MLWYLKLKFWLKLTIESCFLSKTPLPLFTDYSKFTKLIGLCSTFEFSFLERTLMEESFLIIDEKSFLSPDDSSLISTIWSIWSSLELIFCPSFLKTEYIVCFRRRVLFWSWVMQLMSTVPSEGSAPDSSPRPCGKPLSELFPFLRGVGNLLT